MGFTNVPLHAVCLKSDLVTGRVVVGVRPSLPVDGVSFILGNDLAGGRVLVNPEVTPVPIVDRPDELTQKYPDVFPTCAVTRAMSKRLTGSPDSATASGESEIDWLAGDLGLSDLFAVKPEPDVQTPLFAASGEERAECVAEFGKLSLAREQLVEEQKKDTELSSLFEKAIPEEEVALVPTAYFLKDDVLMRKWRPVDASVQDDWRVIHQIVVPTAYRGEILCLAHDSCLAGHLGVNKTHDRVLKHFFWPGLKRDVAKYCETCHVCQVTGKPNLKIPPAPLYPIPVVGGAFERVLVDIVGPLPRTKSGNQYLLTIMCVATRFPEAIPLQKITAPVVVKALVKLFSLFGLPKAIQSDQGTNFMSNIFAQVLDQLAIKHFPSSAYHPESQGVLEQFHQTLKSMLRAYCLEFEKDWDEGVHLMLFAVREVVQESLGFSPAELVFGHTVPGPLKLLKEKWLTEDSHMNLLDFVCNFRLKLHRAGELARENLESSQKRMKCWFDRGAEMRTFSPGDKVMVLLPIPGSVLQARYSGPYLIECRVGDRDYLIATPDRRKRSRLCHVNMIKPCWDRQPGEEGEVKGVALSGITFTPPEQEGGDVLIPPKSVTEGRLQNYEFLRSLEVQLSHLSSDESAEIARLIRSHLTLFSDVPTRTHLLEHDIDVGGFSPIKQHPYRVNPEKHSQLKKKVDYMLKNGIAEPSSSDWSSPCLLVNKPDGTFCFCTDYRKVNTVTKPDCYPLPRMDDCVDRVGSAAYVSKFDLLKGYWQVPLSKRAKEISAFVTPDTFLQYTVMPFGMRNAPATFQRLVNLVVSDLPGCEAYLDDLVIYSATWAEHINQMGELFDRLSAANLTVNLAKCEFGQATVMYLGKVVGRGQVHPVDSKVESVLAFPAPKTRRELRRFLGMVGYYRSFCKNFSAVVSPLTDLLSPKTYFTWTDKCQRSFENVKALLVSTPVLSAPDFIRPFKLLWMQVTVVLEPFSCRRTLTVLIIPCATFRGSLTDISGYTPR
ncbi:uncharacterized protein LOC118206694 [Anguilla anguilla]|uniref:uncharacterized protein LOC118206694 n=1 Tax=Anguilla anguilla TaxID=7936 RepID=UPI0015AD42BD|nr:uncharacterized protein LOC118206694 [Anguilla anguilla]